jgi:hypothetical protein
LTVRGRKIVQATAYRKSDPEAYNAYRRDLQARKMETDPNYRLRRRLRLRLYQVLKDVGAAKVGSAVELLGCTVEELRVHLETQFKPGMTWSNWGPAGWHIDHRQPLAGFDLQDPEQLARACHHTNLQPMWAKDNLKKGKKAA